MGISSRPSSPSAYKVSNRTIERTHMVQTYVIQLCFSDTLLKYVLSDTRHDSHQRRSVPGTRRSTEGRQAALSVLAFSYQTRVTGSKFALSAIINNQIGIGHHAAGRSLLHQQRITTDVLAPSQQNGIYEFTNECHSKQWWSLSKKIQALYDGSSRTFSVFTTSPDLALRLGVGEASTDQ